MNLNLTDTAITINGFIASCHCKCKHCLLCSGDSRLSPVSFEKLAQLALKFCGFQEKTGIDAGLCVYNCSDYPQLPQAMQIDRKISIYHGYQNLNGTPVRRGKELAEWVCYLKNDCGVTHANISWFGTETFHDQFVQAPGYFHYLTDLSKELSQQNIPFSNSIFILNSNLSQLETLHKFLLPLKGSMHYSLLDYRGNAKNILHEFINSDTIKNFPKFLLDGKFYNINRYKMNSAWIDAVQNGTAPALSKRSMFLVAPPDNIDLYLSLSPNEIIDMFHLLDYKIQSKIPSLKYLAAHYAATSGELLMDYRSAVWRWTELFFEDQSIDPSLLFSDLHNSVMWR